MARPRTAEVRTEHLLTELLEAQGWNTDRPPRGQVVRQHEYRSIPTLKEVFEAASKSGGGGVGVPEAVVVEAGTLRPLMVIEAKADVGDIDTAVADLTGAYGPACLRHGFAPLALAVAGASDEHFDLRVLRWSGTRWEPVTYDAKPIRWIPNPADALRLMAPTSGAELRPTVPPPEVLNKHADEINRLLRESEIRDELRPGVVAATILGLWHARGDIRRGAEFILSDLNVACEKAFWAAKKAELAGSLKIPSANAALATKMPRIVRILELLNVAALSEEHDYLGTLYEHFFRYTGGNTIGQYFTPRHVTQFMAQMVGVTSRDVVLDPACGTGGFLIAAIQEIQRQGDMPRAQVIKAVRDQLVGLESEPLTAALCVANMILRGDGKSGVHMVDCFDDKHFPKGRATLVLMNPPFPHEKTDTPVEQFVERALEGLQQRGRAAIIVPASLLVKVEKKPWWAKLKRSNSVLASIMLPDELFQPYASVNTAVVVLEKGTPHKDTRATFFARIENDGLRLRKGVRVRRDGSQLEAVARAFSATETIPGVCGWAVADNAFGWAPGAYIPAEEHPRERLEREVGELVRRECAFVARFAPELEGMRRTLSGDAFRVVREVRQRRKFRGGGDSDAAPTIGSAFDVSYGQRELHDKSGLATGLGLVVSSSGSDNGCYGFFDIETLVEAPFVTVPSSGSIGEARVQLFSCGVTDDCLILRARNGTPPEALWVAAAVLRLERWRFNYRRKITPERIADFPLPLDEGLLAWVRGQAAAAAVAREAALRSLGGLSSGSRFFPGQGSPGPLDLDPGEAQPEGVKHLTSRKAKDSFDETIVRVANEKERVLVTERGKPIVAMIPAEDLELLQGIEDRLDVEAAREALRGMAEAGEPPVPFDEFWKRLGL